MTSLSFAELVGGCAVFIKCRFLGWPWFKGLRLSSMFLISRLRGCKLPSGSELSFHSLGAEKGSWPYPGRPGGQCHLFMISSAAGKTSSWAFR